jgi:thiosulfate dehydrogenase (quinone) large subunit
MSSDNGGRHGRQSNVIQDPPFVWALFGDTRIAWLWLAARVYLGWLWLDSGRNRLRDDAWMDGGLAVKSLWERSLNAPEQRPPVAYDWYRDVLQFMLDHKWYVWIAPIVAVGETLLGIALILGFTTGLAALLGSLLNVNFVLAGAASANPVLLVLAIALMLAWKTAGWIGLDHWVLPIVGKMWSGDGTSRNTSPIRQRGHPAQAASRS